MNSGILFHNNVIVNTKLILITIFYLIPKFPTQTAWHKIKEVRVLTPTSRYFHSYVIRNKYNPALQTKFFFLNYSIYI